MRALRAQQIPDGITAYHLTLFLVFLKIIIIIIYLILICFIFKAIKPYRDLGMGYMATFGGESMSLATWANRDAAADAILAWVLKYNLTGVRTSANTQSTVRVASAVPSGNAVLLLLMMLVVCNSTAHSQLASKAFNFNT